MIAATEARHALPEDNPFEMMTNSPALRNGSHRPGRIHEKDR